MIIRMSLPAEHMRRRDQSMTAQRNDSIGSSRCRVQLQVVRCRGETAPVQRQHHQQRQETGPQARKSHGEQWRTDHSVLVHRSIRAHGESKVVAHVLRHTVRNCIAVIVLTFLFPIWLISSYDIFGGARGRCDIPTTSKSLTRMTRVDVMIGQCELRR